MPILNRDSILGLRDLEIERLAVPEWGADAEVCLRVMTGAEYDYFDEQIAASPGGLLKNFRPIVCALTLCDEQGGRLFSIEDVEALAEKSKKAIERIYEAACKLNKLRKQDQEELEKNSVADRHEPPGLS